MGSSSVCVCASICLEAPLLQPESPPQVSDQEDRQFLDLWVQELRRSLGWRDFVSVPLHLACSGTRLGIAISAVKWVQACLSSPTSSEMAQYRASSIAFAQ